MTNAIVVILMAMFSVPQPETQKLSDGFYMTVDCSLSSKVIRHNRLNYQDEVCLVQQPFLSTKEIRSVSKMVETGNLVFFDIILTKRAVDLINSLNTNVVNEGIALVIDDEVLVRINPPKNSTIDNILRIMIEPTVQQPHQIRQKIADIASSNQ
jgi:hypothetical protein